MEIHIQPINLPIIPIFVLILLMSTEEREVVKVRVMIKIIGIRVVAKGMLVVPHQWGADERDAQPTNLVDKRVVADGKMGSIMSCCP